MEFFKTLQTGFAFTYLTVENCSFTTLLPFDEQTKHFFFFPFDNWFIICSFPSKRCSLCAACHTHCCSESYLRVDLPIIWQTCRSPEKSCKVYKHLLRLFLVAKRTISPTISTILSGNNILMHIDRLHLQCLKGTLAALRVRGGNKSPHSFGIFWIILIEIWIFIFVSVFQRRRDIHAANYRKRANRYFT